MEKKFLGKLVCTELFCDECKEKMELEKTSFGEYMTLIYHYKCPKCGKVIETTIKYPKVDLEVTHTPIIEKF